MRGCIGLSCLPDEIGGMTSLARLYLGGCTSLESLPGGVSGLAALRLLDASGSGLQSLPPAATALGALETLVLCGCAQLTSTLHIYGLTALRLLNLSRYCLNP